MKSSKSNQNTGDHREWLDLLRFAAALVVVLGHVKGFVFQEYSVLNSESRNVFVAIFYAFSRLGHEAVIVFFVLSGYLVGGKALERIANATFKPADYAIDRIARIWIPLVPALAMSGILAGDANDILTWIGNLLGLQGVLVPTLGGNGPLWSLAYEIWFYVLIYAVGRQTMRKQLDVLALLLLFATALIFTKLEVQYLACWFIGAVFYVRPHRIITFWSLFFSGLLCSGAVAGLQVTSNGIMSFGNEFTALRPCLEMLLAVGTGIACVTLATMKATSVSAVAAPLAAFSYTLYLTHYPLLMSLRKSGWELIAPISLKGFMIYFLAAITCMVVAWAHYFVFERNTSLVRGWIKARCLN